MNRKFKENVAMIVIAHALMLTGPAIVQARGLDNPINFTKPIKSEKGAISPIGPVKDARYFERDDACEIVKAEMGWTDCKTIDLLVINPGAGIDTILLDKPVASGYVTVDDFNSAEAKDVIASIEKSLRGQATAQSEKLGKNIQFTGWRLNPTADKSKGLIYYATDWNWDGESVLSIRVLLLGRFGYTPLQIIPVESNLNSEAIATMVAKTVASYKPDPETAYSDFRPRRQGRSSWWPRRARDRARCEVRQGCCRWRCGSSRHAQRQGTPAAGAALPAARRSLPSHQVVVPQVITLHARACRAPVPKWAAPILMIFTGCR